jgi:predicted TIM-barrel fold metal-dependent hydrolase
MPRGGSRIEITWNADQMRRELDAFFIDAGVVFPDHHLRIGALPNVSYATALARAFHRWLDAEWLDRDNNLYGVIIAIPQDPEEAAREIHRWGKQERFCGVFLPTCQTYPLWGHRKYDPIFAAASEYDLPVLLHSVAGVSPGFPFNLEAFTTHISTHTVSHVLACMANLLSMMETGVPVRYPNLRICFCEAGLSWVPFMRLRLDKEYNEYRYQWPHFDDRPSKWIRKMYFASQPVEEPENPRDLADLIRIYDGDHTTVYASDWPHHDFDHPRGFFDLPVSDTLKRQVMGANALRLLPRVAVPQKYAAVYEQGKGLR